MWFRVNEQLPAASQKSLPDRPPGMNESAVDGHEGLAIHIFHMYI